MIVLTSDKHSGLLGQITSIVDLIENPDADWILALRHSSGLHYGARDNELRPIRPGDIEDETPTEIVKELCNERQF